MLNNQGVTPLSYHLILLFEFFQMLYYVLYKVNFVNEFEPAYNTHSNTTMSNNSVAQNYSLTSREELDESENSKLVQINIFRIDSIFLFANFQLYPLTQARDRLISF